MNAKLLGLSICAISISGCFHDGEQNRLNYPIYGVVTGEIPLLGGLKRVGAHYNTEEGVAGSDGAFLTGDDLITGYDVIDQVSEAIQIGIRFNSPGQDGLWFTDDDMIENYQKHETLGSDGSDKYCDFNSAGPDGKWFTEDDIASNCRINTATQTEGGGRQVKTVFLTSAGADGIWFTSDDVVGDYAVSRFGSDGNWIGNSGGFGAGDDGLLNTADDTAAVYASREQTLSYDANSHTTAALHTDTYDLNGTHREYSGLTITKDADLALSKFGRTSTHSLSLNYKFFSNPGPDGEWLTPDDVLTGKTSGEVLESSGSSFRVRTIVWAPGANGILGDADDTIEKYWVKTEKMGETMDKGTTENFTAGPDGEWFTNDDELVGKDFYISLWPTKPSV